MFRWIGTLLGGLWRIARASRIDVGEGLRPGSGASALYIFFFLVFALAAIVLLALGVDLDEVDRWLDRQGGWLGALGTIAFKALLALVLLACLFAGGMAIHGVGRRLSQRLSGRTRKTARTRAQPAEDGLGWGVLLIALVIGYFAAVGLVSKL